MFGLGIGALIGGYYAEKIKNRIVFYSLVEIAIGLFGLLSFPSLLFLGQHTAGSPYILAGFYQFIFLSTPTILMGMTLPILTKIFNSLLADFVKTISLLYFVNTLGAVLGAIIASYILISFWGIDTAIYVAAGINLILAILIFVLKGILKTPPLRNSVPAIVENLSPSAQSLPNLSIPWILFLTGFMAIGYQIVWFRMIRILVKDSPYVFPSILAIYLLGIALGSFFMGKFIKRFSSVNKKNLFFMLQILVAITVACLILAYYYLTLKTSFSFLIRFCFGLPLHPPAFQFPFNPYESATAFLQYVFWSAGVFIWPLFFIFVPTFFIGASFPLISDLALVEQNNESKTVGRVYFFNTVGNVFGGLITGFVLLHYGGTELTLFIFIVVGLLFSLGMSFSNKRAAWAIQINVLVLIVLIWIFFPKRGELYKVIHKDPGPNYDTYFEEGLNGVILTYKKQGEDGIINYINGHPHGGRPGYSFYVQVMEAVSLSRSVENVLVIGYGTGSIAEAVLKIPNVKKLTVIEINQTLMRNLRKMELFQNLLSDPRLEIVYDDGRRFLLREKEKFDLIFMNSLRTTTSYSNNLYSKQFFELVAKRLTPSGIFSTWTDEFDVMSKTITTVFNDARLYARKNDGFFLASGNIMEPQKENHAIHLLNSFSPQQRINLFSTRNDYNATTKLTLSPYGKTLPINQDWKPAVEYYIGLDWKKKVF